MNRYIKKHLTMILCYDSVHPMITPHGATPHMFRNNLCTHRGRSNRSSFVSKDFDLYSVGDRLCLVGDVWLIPSLEPIMNGDSLPRTDPGLSPRLAS